MTLFEKALIEHNNAMYDRAAKAVMAERVMVVDGNKEDTAYNLGIKHAIGAILALKK